MDSLPEIHLDPDRRARSRAFAILATAALVSALTGLLFVMIWKNYVEGLEPEYFREQGVQWGEEFHRRIRAHTNRFSKGARIDEIRFWRETLGKDFRRYFEEEFKRNPSLRPRRVSLKFKNEDKGHFETAVRVGRDLQVPIANRLFEKDLDSGFDIAVDSRDGLVVVVVDGLVTGIPEGMQGDMRFNLALEFPSFQTLADRGTTYAALLVIVYLAIIYLLFILVFRLGRRQMSLALSAKEKSIRLKAISSVAEGIAHEVRNPLNAISLNVQYMEKLAAKPGFVAQPGDYQRVYRELGKIRKVIDNFVNFAKSKDLEISRWSLSDAMNESLQSFEVRFKDEAVTVNKQYVEDSMLSGDRSKITKVFENLIENAIEAMTGEPQKAIDIEIIATPETVHATIRNNGASPDEEVVKNMFDPYFSTRSGSLGLGLTLAKTVVESHGGRISAKAGPEGGLLVTVSLPRVF